MWILCEYDTGNARALQFLNTIQNDPGTDTVRGIVKAYAATMLGDDETRQIQSESASATP